MNTPPLPAFRRIVTGHDSAGRARVAMAGATPHTFPLAAVPGTVFYEVWRSAGAPALLGNGGDPTAAPLQLSPAASGSVIRVVDIPPDRAQNRLEAAQAFAELGEVQAGTATADSKHALMHRTATLDYGIVTEGEVWLVLDEEEVRLRRGDIVVQRGTNHAWSNRTDALARMVFILLDGRYTPELMEVLP